MKSNPLQARMALADWPRWVQPIFTWLSGIALPGETRKRPWTVHKFVIAQFTTLLVAGSVGVQSASQLLHAQQPIWA